MNEPKYPQVTVKLVGQDGNAFAIMSRVRKAIADAVSYEAANDYIEEATNAASYDDFLALTMRTVNTI